MGCTFWTSKDIKTSKGIKTSKDIKPFSHWGEKNQDGRTKPVAEGGFGKVYGVDVVPAIQVHNHEC
jgi:hypothetical protein